MSDLGATWGSDRLALFTSQVQALEVRLDQARERRRRRFGDAPPELEITPRRSRFMRELEERPRRRGAPASVPFGSGVFEQLGLGGDAAAREQSTASLLASGYQPAVLKVISYGHGRARASAMASYLQRGDVELETHDGRLLDSKEKAAEEMRIWSRDFEKRRPSDDVATLIVKVAGLTADDAGRAELQQSVRTAFDGHSFTFRIESDGDSGLQARVLCALAGRAAEGGTERFRLVDARTEGERGLSRRSHDLLAERIAATAGRDQQSVSIGVSEVGHAKNGVVYQLSHAARSGLLTSDDGKLLSDEAAVRATAAAWERGLRSYAPRDTMHLILSAKADVDETALKDAARGFLHQTFADHRFVFALHNDRAGEGHVHVHAVVAVRSETGAKIHPGRETFSAWRQAYAEQAQAQGIRIAAVTSMQRASSQSYGPCDKAIVDVADNPRPHRLELDRAYARRHPQVIEQARERIAKARANPIRIPSSDRQLLAVNASLAAWRAEAVANPRSELVQTTISRLATAASAGHVVVQLRDFTGGRDMAQTSQALRDELRILNQQRGEAAASLSGESKAQFLRTTEQTLNLMALRSDLMEMKEQGVTSLTAEDMKRLMSAETAQLIAKANSVSGVEQREAERAETIARRAAEEAHRDSGRVGQDPESLRDVGVDREVARTVETIAARERREADAAKLAAAALGTQPSRPMDPNVALNDRIAELKREQEELQAETDKAKPQRL